MSVYVPLSILCCSRFARVVALGLFPVALGVAAAEPNPPSAPKTHQLFMGSQLSVVSKETSLPVKDVKSNSFVVSGPKGDLIVPPDDAQFRLKLTDTLKLTTRSAQIDKLVFERAYTAANDPIRRFADAARVDAYMAEGADSAIRAVTSAETALGVANASVESASPLDRGSALATQAMAASQLSSAQSSLSLSQTRSGMDAFSSVTSSSRLTSDLNAELFDAIRITFAVSSPRPLTTPYVVIFMRFLEDKDRADTANVWVYAQKLPDISEQPRSFTILRGGFPPGYHIDSYHVHLYEGTEEIATNVSRKQMALTADEAFQYSVIQHITGNRAQTRAAAKATFFWPQELTSRVTPTKLSESYFVKVGKDGRVQGIFEDRDGKKPVTDPEISDLKPALRFLPALEKGKPVEAIAAFKLGAGN